MIEDRPIIAGWANQSHQREFGPTDKDMAELKELLKQDRLLEQTYNISLNGRTRALGALATAWELDHPFADTILPPQNGEPRVNPEP